MGTTPSVSVELSQCTDNAAVSIQLVHFVHPDGVLMLFNMKPCSNLLSVHCSASCMVYMKSEQIL